MATGFNNTTDLYRIFDVVQNTMIRYPKDIVISSLREFFSKDSYYHYVSDPWGFPQTPDHTDLDPQAGLFDDLTTRIFIGEAYRFNVIYYPAILVRSGSWRHVPISLNRDQHRIDYATTKFIDNDNNEKLVQVPSKFILSGAWEGSLIIEVITRDLRARDDLIELLSIFFIDLNWNSFYKSGVSIKPTFSIGSPTETEDRNDKLCKQSINLDMRVEWRREILVENVVDIIGICVDFGNLDKEPIEVAPNITINNTLELLDILNDL